MAGTKKDKKQIYGGPIKDGKRKMNPQKMPKPKLASRIISSEKNDFIEERESTKV